MKKNLHSAAPCIPICSRIRGKSWNFMGNELGHFREWDESRELDWELLRYPAHDSFFLFFRELATLYLTSRLSMKESMTAPVSAGCPTDSAEQETGRRLRLPAHGRRPDAGGGVEFQHQAARRDEAWLCGSHRPARNSEQWTTCAGAEAVSQILLRSLRSPFRGHGSPSTVRLHLAPLSAAVFALPALRQQSRGRHGPFPAAAI